MTVFVRRAAARHLLCARIGSTRTFPKEVFEPVPVQNPFGAAAALSVEGGCAVSPVLADLVSSAPRCLALVRVQPRLGYRGFPSAWAAKLASLVTVFKPVTVLVDHQARSGLYAQRSHHLLVVPPSGSSPEWPFVTGDQSVAVTVHRVAWSQVATELASLVAAPEPYEAHVAAHSLLREALGTQHYCVFASLREIVTNLATYISDDLRSYQFVRSHWVSALEAGAGLGPPEWERRRRLAALLLSADHPLDRLEADVDTLVG